MLLGFQPVPTVQLELFSGINYSFLPPMFSHWINDYLNGDVYAEAILHRGRSGFFWVTLLFSYINYVVYLLVAVWLIKQRDVILVRQDIGKLYSFYLVLFSVTNFIRMLPTIGQRYLWTVQILSVYLLFKVYYPAKKRYFLLLLFGWSYHIFMRWIYNGAGTYLVPRSIYYDNLVSLIVDYL